jgi:putative ABC transport system ATP-binding protein
MTLRADNVYRFYRAGDEETLAIQGVSLEVRPGELVALCGPSGSGKSTLLACLAGTDEPSGGTVWIDGERMSGRTEGARARLRARSVGTMAQSGNLFPHLTVSGNLRLARGLSGRRGRNGPEPHQLLDDLGIGARAGAWPEELSGGELVRAALAVALANGPAVLLADEPTGELDEATEARLLSLLRRRAHDGCAVLVASHSEAVSGVADRTLVLSDGRLS